MNSAEKVISIFSRYSTYVDVCTWNQGEQSFFLWRPFLQTVLPLFLFPFVILVFQQSEIDLIKCFGSHHIAMIFEIGVLYCLVNVHEYLVKTRKIAS